MTTENKPRFPNTLEYLVPPLELCRKIPKGDFGYSALTWNEGYVKGNFVIEQRGLGRYYICPAPTLQEIIDQLGNLDMWRNAKNNWEVFSHADPETILRECDTNPATAALKLWLELSELSVPSDPSDQSVNPRRSHEHHSS